MGELWHLGEIFHKDVICMLRFKIEATTTDRIGGTALEEEWQKESGYQIMVNESTDLTGTVIPT